MVIAISASAVMKRQDALFVDGGANSDLVPTLPVTTLPRRAISPSNKKEKKHWLGFNTSLLY